MTSAIEVAIDTYVRAANERDAARREQLLSACFAADGRMVTRGRELRGRAAISEMIGRFLSNPQVLRVRVSSAIDAGGTTFRYRAVADMADGSTPEVFDAGELDADGKIALILTFAGPLPDAAP